MTEQEIRAKVVATAVSYLGRKEANGTHRPIIDLYNSHKPLARGYAVKYTDAWCATFVSAVGIALGYTDIMPTECGCGKMIDLYKKLGRWQESDTYTPEPGDIIMYDWQDGGIGDNRGAPDHVGIVVSVSGGTIKVIEGNMDNAVGYRNIKVNGKNIRGYCLPDYAKKATGKAPVKPIAPKPAAKPETVKRDPAKSFSKAFSRNYTVTASALNMRAGAGKDKTVLTTLKKGAAFRCYGYYTQQPDGTVWLYGVSGENTGYCSLRYLK